MLKHNNTSSAGMIVLYLIVFVVTYCILHALYFNIPDQLLREYVYPLGITHICSSLINMAVPAEAVMSHSNTLQSSRASLEIVRGCDGIGSIMLIVSAMVAFSAPIKHKLIGLIFCFVFMYGLNLLRIIGLYFTSAYHAEWFTLLHTYVAPTLVIILGCLFFAWWTTWPTRCDHADIQTTG